MGGAIDDQDREATFFAEILPTSFLKFSAVTIDGVADARAIDATGRDVVFHRDRGSVAYRVSVREALSRDTRRCHGLMLRG